MPIRHPLFEPRPIRTIYALRNAEGRYLAELEPGFGPKFVDSPVEALRSHMAWLTQEVAIARRKTFRANSKLCPDLVVTSARVRLTPEGWELAPEEGYCR